ncbi:helix-turn-helix domain-containing GNAT family N-acetyltransferase [Devosia sp. FKR38]|uniref:bifunctional helix-turn-helix transcriptional regulator/GNAT family N-acetyltransferase n=1 Tax=Devosia sp. FKR38 TaxID=2562312 RepID=UPI0010C12050|nr:helix-turn-helix domain-containing GNAT family N-acetyltransferase [Devosia sp. FKR38]
MTDQQIADIRAFNRFYTKQIGLLEEHFADGPLSLPEARVLYEIDARGHVTGSDLFHELRMDRGYLSRMLAKFVDAGLTAVSPTPGDRRSNTIALTADGDLIVERLNRRSDDAVADLVYRLSPSQKGELVDAMRTVRRLLGDASLSRGPVVIRGHRLGELGWLVHRQGLVYNEQFGWNIEFEALIAAIYSQFQFAPDAPPKQLWVAEQDGAIVGSIFVMPSDGLPGSAQLRMLYVEPAARGQGVGAALVGQAVSFARQSGYQRMRLWTHANQTSARKLYAGAGFEIVETMPEHNFGKDLDGEIWELAL